MPTSANQMLVALPAMELQHLLDIAASVSSSSETWLREYPIVKRPSVTAACALVSTVAMPGLAVPELDLLTRWWLWIFGVDDVLDDLEIPDEPVALGRAVPARPAHQTRRQRPAPGGVRLDPPRPAAVPALPVARGTLAYRDGRDRPRDATGTAVEWRGTGRSAELRGVPGQRDGDDRAAPVHAHGGHPRWRTRGRRRVAGPRPDDLRGRPVLPAGQRPPLRRPGAGGGQAQRRLAAAARLRRPRSPQRGRRPGRA